MATPKMIEEYVQQHQVFKTLDVMTTKMVMERPTDPLGFMINHLQQQQAAGGAPPALPAIRPSTSESGARPYASSAKAAARPATSDAPAKKAAAPASVAPAQYTAEEVDELKQKLFRGHMLTPAEAEAVRGAL